MFALSIPVARAQKSQLWLLLTVALAIVAMLGLFGRCLSVRENASVVVPRLEPIGEARLHEVLRKNKGEVVVVNFWATWCEPCREEFPDLVRLYRTYQKNGLHLVFLSMDEPDQKDKVQQFLKENQVDFVTYIRTEGDFESLVNSIDPNWIGGIPATFIYDRQGKRVKTLVGGHTFETFEKAIQPLM